MATNCLTRHHVRRLEEPAHRVTFDKGAHMA
jgi:hypothetical protein